MSAAKRSRRALQQPEAGQATGAEASLSTPPEESTIPTSKRLKSSHVPAKNGSGLAFLLDDNTRESRKLDARLTNGVPGRNATRVDESRAVVAADASGTNAALNGSIDISSSEESESEDSEGEEEVEFEEEAEEQRQEPPKTNGHKELAVPVSRPELVGGVDDVDMADEDESENEEPRLVEEPSFGDLLKTRHPDRIDVLANLPDPHAEPPHLVPASGKAALIRPVTGHSLTTVLQQALKTNDKDMLESCFQIKDIQAVRNTIQRLQSPLVGDMIARVSERMYHRPGRMGSLMIWIQWSLVAHGGYLATQPDILRRLKSLNRVIRQRAQGLQPLLQLKGKLDMLSAQLELRRAGLSHRLNVDAEDDEEGVVYVEGDEEADWAEKENGDEDQRLLEPPPQSNKQKSKTSAVNMDDGVDDGDDDLLNGVTAEVDDEESSVDEEDEDEEGINGMLDIEAEETDDDDDAEEDEEDEEESAESSAESEVDEDDDEDEVEDGPGQVVKQPRPQTLNRKR